MSQQVEVATGKAVEEYAALLAIDWADQKHVWALPKAGTSEREQGEIEASPEAVEVWVNEVMAGCVGRPIAVALEQKRGALLCLLSKYPALVLYPVHPATVSRMRAALYPSASKDDPKRRSSVAEHSGLPSNAFAAAGRRYRADAPAAVSGGGPAQAGG